MKTFLPICVGRAVRTTGLALLAAIASQLAFAQQTWSSGTFPVAEPLNSPSQQSFSGFVTTHGLYPAVAYGVGAWHFIDGNALTPRVFDPGNGSFADHDSTFYFATQSLTGPPQNTWGVETVVALAAGQDRTVAFSDADRVAVMNHFDDSFNFSPLADGPENISRIRDVVYSPYDDRWVAVAVKLFSSETGASWSTRRGNTGSGEIWQAVAAGPDFVAVSDDGTAIRSTDGLTWLNPVTINSSINFQDIHYAAGQYVAVGEDRIYSSTDGVSWTSQYLYPGANFQSVTYGNGTWVAITTTGDRVHYSTNADASSWSSHTNITPASLRKIVYGDGIFVAIGTGGQYRWSEASLEVPDPVAFGSGGGPTFRFVASDWPETGWFASSPDEWIHLADNWDPSGTGTSALSFLADSNSGNDRIGCIEVNGRPFPVTQSGTLGPVAIPFTKLDVHPLSAAFLVTWGDVTTETGYQVERWTDDSGVWTLAAQLPADTTHYYDGVVDPGDLYAYRVLPTGSGSSSLATAQFAALDPTEGVNTIAVPLGDDRILLAWSPYSASNYHLTRNGTHLVPNVDGMDPQAYFDETYIDDLSGTSLTGGYTSLTYQVSYNQGTASSFVSFPAFGLLSPPLAGQFIGTSEPLSPSVNRLSWKPAVAQSGGNPIRFDYLVQRAANGSSNYTNLATTNSPEYIDDSTGGARYRYRVQAAEASNPDTVSGFSELCPRLPARPFDLNASFTQTSVSLSFEFTDYNADSWELQQQAESGSWFSIRTAPLDTIDDSYAGIGLTPGNTYNYRLRTTWRGVPSDWIETGPQKSDLADPRAPIVNDSDPGEIFLNWPDLNGAEFYQLQRSLTGTGSWTTIAPLIAESRYTDTDVVPQTTYYYRVRGAHGWDNSGYSPVVSGTPPLDLALIFNYHDLRRFRFTPPAGYATAILQRATNRSFTSAVDVDTYNPRPPFETFQVSDRETLGIGIFYHYRVRFTGVPGNPTTESRQIYPPVAPATNLTAVIDQQVVELSWTAPPSGERYEIERREVTTPASDFQSIAVDLISVSHTDVTAAPGTNYEYRVLAKGPFPFWQPSRPSNIASVTFGNSVAAWRDFHFGTTSNTGIAANHVDPDGGGLDNLGELLFDRDPNDPSDDHVLFIEREPNASPLVRVSFKPREDYLDWPVDFLLMSGTTLASFPTDLTSELSLNPDDKSLEYFADTRVDVDRHFHLEFEEQ